MIWLVAAGSALGGVLRYLAGNVVQRWAGSTFPVGTLFVNLSGSFLIGVVIRVASDTGMSPALRTALAAGFCGGYTTFSAFSYETVALLEAADYGRAIVYVVGSVTLALTATAVGLKVAAR
jgi:fluoride exporter